eukprot:4925-Chlamydomonas_euryale.AAC.3
MPLPSQMGVFHCVLRESVECHHRSWLDGRPYLLKANAFVAYNRDKKTNAFVAYLKNKRTNASYIASNVRSYHHTTRDS